jgi:predicted nuclease with TOPRIM domain
VFAVIAVIALLVIAFNAIKNASPEAKLKKAETAAAEAGEAADKAADEYKELKSSLDGLDDKYKNIENLTMYTDEWKEAVKGVNDEVLDLMTKYPELAKYVKSVNGVLTLDTDSDDVQAVIDKYEQISNYARASDYGA